MTFQKLRYLADDYGIRIELYAISRPMNFILGHLAREHTQERTPIREGKTLNLLLRKKFTFLALEQKRKAPHCIWR